MNPAGALKYAYTELRDHYDDPVWIRERIVQRLVRPVHRYYPGSDGAVRIVDEDWDTLVVLDACRADLFEQVADRDGFDQYGRRKSAGSMTKEWTERNFADEQLGDTVYIAANPYTSTVAGDSFHEVVELWRDEFDETERTVTPATVTQAAIEAHERHPNKRLIVHYMQPHYPFLGHPELRFQSWTPSEITDNEYDGERPHDPWQALEMGLADRKDVWEAYAENLERVLQSVSELLDGIDGKTVLTSDHGNLLGERLWPVPIRAYGHPSGVRHPCLVDVPWAVIDGVNRRTIRDDGVHDIDEANSDVVEDRLQDLGYV